MKKLNVTVIRASVLTVFIALSATHASADTFTYFSGLIPEPTTMLLLATGLAGVAASSITQRRKRL